MSCVPQLSISVALATPTRFFFVNPRVDGTKSELEHAGRLDNQPKLSPVTALMCSSRILTLFLHRPALPCPVLPCCGTVCAERVRFGQVLLKNRAKVLYCTRLKGAQTEEDKQAIQASYSLKRYLAKREQ